MAVQPRSPCRPVAVRGVPLSPAHCTCVMAAAASVRLPPWTGLDQPRRRRGCRRHFRGQVVTFSCLLRRPAALRTRHTGAQAWPAAARLPSCSRYFPATPRLRCAWRRGTPAGQPCFITACTCMRCILHFPSMGCCRQCVLPVGAHVARGMTACDLSAARACGGCRGAAGLPRCRLWLWCCLVRLVPCSAVSAQVVVFLCAHWWRVLGGVRWLVRCSSLIVRGSSGGWV